MPACTAELKSKPGVLCSRNAHFTAVRPLCGMHHNSAMKDAAYKSAYNLAVHGPPPPVDTVAAQEAARNIRVAAHNRRIEELVNSSMTDIMRYTRRLITLWFTENIHGYDLVKAYAILRYCSYANAHYHSVLEAAARVTLLGNGYHPDHANYSDVPAAERGVALERLSIAVTLYNANVDIHILSRQNDTHWPRVFERLQREEQQRREAQRERERLDFERRLQQEAVVFKRDPEGSIDLRAFANDEQSVHRSSVQTGTERAVHMLISRPLKEGQETLVEITVAFLDPKMIKWNTVLRDRCITELTNDYFNTEAFSIPYGKVTDHVWAFINSHEHRRALIIRLAQEIQEGIRQCSNGKMARLVNVLRGFDESLDTVPSDEVKKLMFQNKIARLMERPVQERKAAAESLFNEFSIPNEEREVWLVPLLE